MAFASTAISRPSRLRFRKTYLAYRAQKQINEIFLRRTQLLSQVDWSCVLVLIVAPIYGFCEAAKTPLHPKTAIWSTVLWILTGLGITAGYHRLWAHTSYSATLPLRVFLALMGGAAIQRSIRWWARGHRAHHMYTDTNKDPYSVNKGFWYAHIGWMLFKQKPGSIGRAYIPDLYEDPVVIWQHNNLSLISTFMGFLIPILVPGLAWGDWWGGFVYAVILRIFAVHQFTFSVNSIAHTLGEKSFDRAATAGDHFFTAIVTLGEGYHNFHHRFPCDFRNGIHWYHYDPTK